VDSAPEAKEKTEQPEKAVKVQEDAIPTQQVNEQDGQPEKAVKAQEDAIPPQQVNEQDGQPEKAVKAQEDAIPTQQVNKSSAVDSAPEAKEKTEQPERVVKVQEAVKKALEGSETNITASLKVFQEKLNEIVKSGEDDKGKILAMKGAYKESMKPIENDILRENLSKSGLDNENYSSSITEDELRSLRNIEKIVKGPTALESLVNKAVSGFKVLLSGIRSVLGRVGSAVFARSNDSPEGVAPKEPPKGGATEGTVKGDTQQPINKRLKKQSAKAGEPAKNNVSTKEAVSTPGSPKTTQGKGWTSLS